MKAAVTVGCEKMWQGSKPISALKAKDLKRALEGEIIEGANHCHMRKSHDICAQLEKFLRTWATTFCTNWGLCFLHFQPRYSKLQ